MKALDLETKSIHKVKCIDFDDYTVVMESKEYGCTRQSLDKIIFIKEDADPKILDINNF